MKNIWLIAFLVALLLIALPVRAQEDEPALVLQLTRDFGYGGFDSDIQGLFSLIADGPADLVRVDFYIDEQLIFSDSEDPFRFQFSTGSYSAGQHRLYAIGTTDAGLELHSNEFVRLFLSDEEARGKVVELVLPLLVITGGVILLSTILPMLIGGKKAEIGKYGLSGGAVCPQCDLPLPIHFFSLNVGFKKLERCPHCGNWVRVRKAKPEDLRIAEARWRGDGNSATRKDDDKRLLRQIDDSRYER